MGGSALLREWLDAALRGSEFSVEAPEGGTAGIVLVDAEDGGRAASQIRGLRESGDGTPIVVLTAGRWRGLNEQAAEAGAQGTLVKTGSVAELLVALRAVARGGTSFDVRHPPRPPDQATLSRRERQVLQLVARGATNREIAAELGIGAETVKTVLARSSAKLGVHGRREAVAAAHGLGLL